MLISPASGLSSPIFLRAPSISASTISPRSSAITTLVYSAMSASFIAPRPIARRALKPVPTPKSIRPGASAFSVASEFAVTAAIRFDGTSTPVPSRIREVFTAAAPMATKQSALIIWVS